MFEQIKAARERIRGHANLTPVMTSRTLNTMIGTKIFLKCENFQRGGAFKFRGAYNAMAKLSDAQKTKGVITHSSGNHAQATALVGKLLGISTTVVMPNDAPETKRDATETYGANVVEYAPEETTREEIAKTLQAEHDYILIPPFDHPDVIAGQGTAALELVEEVKTLDLLLVPCGGGGLLTGTGGRRHQVFSHRHSAHRKESTHDCGWNPHFISGRTDLSFAAATCR
jgi:threonine dehydratase